jgi:hypothetical protein
MARGGAAAVAASIALVSASGCASHTVVGRVEIPAEAGPGETSFGYGTVGLASGDQATLPQARSVLVAATSDPAGPSEASEGDSLWRVRGGMLELCEWRADGRDDCRLAGYEGWNPAGGPEGSLALGAVAFFPSILKTTSASEASLGHALAKTPAGAASPSSVLRILLQERGTPALPATKERAIWVSPAASSLLGAQPAFLCVADPIPTCRALPFMVANVVAVMVVAQGDRRVPVLWAQGGQTVGAGFGGVVVVENLGMYRCESREGKPDCKLAKEIP